MGTTGTKSSNRGADSIRLAATVFVAALFALAATALAQPSEENIGASPRRPSVSRATAEPTGEERGATSESAEPGAASESSAASPATTSQPKAHFPYTVRSGDTLGSIAAVFGISVDDLTRLNRLSEDSELMVGQTLKVPNPSVARERELSSEIDKLSSEKQASDQRAEKAESALGSARARAQDLDASNQEYGHEVRMLPWWRGAAMTAAAAAILMLGVMSLALFEWWALRNRFRAVAEMNESLRRLDFKYKTALGKAELRLQELYGRRRRGFSDGQERPKLPEELEIEELSHQLKEVLEQHLQRLGPAGERAQRARDRERVSGIGSPVEARTVRR